MTTISEGSKVANITAQMTGDQSFSLDDYIGKNVIIYFYPKDNTPGCTTEGIEFSAAYEQLSALNTIVFGVSRDSLKTHENFKAKHHFPFELISDPDELVCRHFDVIKLKKLYGKEHMGIERSTFLIDTTGKLVKVWRKVKVKGHVEEVVAAVKSLT